MAHSKSRSYAERVGSSSAVSSVLFARGESFHQETKLGSYVYWGDASNYHEWEFRTRLRVHGKEEHFYTEAVSKVVDGLRGDAFVCAQSVGLDTLWKQSVTIPGDEQLGEVDVTVEESGG